MPKKGQKPNISYLAAYESRSLKSSDKANALQGKPFHADPANAKYCDFIQMQPNYGGINKVIGLSVSGISVKKAFLAIHPL